MARGVVALRKESVDRNLNLACNGILRLVSLSARRAWIEMFAAVYATSTRDVALRKESVDRNVGGKYDAADHAVVALRKESVDRNQ